MSSNHARKIAHERPSAVRVNASGVGSTDTVPEMYRRLAIHGEMCSREALRLADDTLCQSEW